jgi:hypothetical protein
MSKKIEKQVAIQRSVMAVMEQHLPAWQQVAELKKSYDLFVKNLKKINDSSGLLKLDLAPLKKKRLKSRESLILHIRPVIAVLGVYANDTGDKKLAGLVRVKSGELGKMGKQGLKKYCQKLIKTTTTLLEPARKEEKQPPSATLSGYGLTPGHLMHIQKALETYLKDDLQYSDSRARKEKAKSVLAKRIEANNSLLKAKMNKLVSLFRNSDKAFYGSYLIALNKAARKPQRKATPSAPQRTGAQKTVKKPAARTVK